MRIENNVALIENPLLCSAIWGDTKCKYKTEFTGYVNANADHVGRAFIEYCLARIFSIFRLPQRGYDNYLRNRCFYDDLSDELINNACLELQAVIKHVQGELRKSPMVNDGKVSVVRCLSDFQVDEIASQLADNERKIIDLPVSILSSYSYDGNVDESYPTHREDYKKHINIKENVSVDNIVLWDQFVGNGMQECPYVKSMYDVEKELWVIDRSISGIRRLPRSYFHFNDGLPQARFGVGKYPRNEYGIDKPIHGGIYKKYPCESNNIIFNYLLKKNIEKIRSEEQQHF